MTIRRAAAGLLLLASALLLASESAAARVELQRTAKGWKLLRDGRHFFIRGVAGDRYLEQARQCGANAIRTWSSRFLGRTLEAAQAHGLAVAAGLWLPQVRHGFDYSDRLAVERVKRKLRLRVRQYRDHPALLMWIVGNEVALGRRDDGRVYAAINEIARMVKAIDPLHPVATVVADIGPHGEVLQYIQRHCPDIDILGINSYGGLKTLSDRLMAGGWRKAYMITEFGPPGPWEAPLTGWGAPIEMTSTEKARYYYDGYVRSVISHTNGCLGCFAFLWGNKMEETPTWFGMFLPHGQRLGAVDWLQYAWTGTWPTNRCPEIGFLASRVAEKTAKRGGEYALHFKVVDPDGDRVRLRWVLVRERREGQDSAGKYCPLEEWKEIPNPKIILRGGKYYFRAPAQPGEYRLFLYAFDGCGGACTANFPFRVE